MVTVKDVVCVSNINPNTAAFQLWYRGKTYYICSHACHDKFMAEPQKYASHTPSVSGTRHYGAQRMHQSFWVP